MDVEVIKNQISDFFKEQKGISAVVLFGSFATNKVTSRSDVDIAVLFDYSMIPNPWDLLDIRETLSGILSKDVDLVCLNNANPIIGMQVYKTGKIIWKNGKSDLDRYFMTLISQYIEIKEIRKPMEDAILKRKIHD